MRSDVWTSLAVYADETVVGHVMWGVDDDGSRWIGGMVIDAVEQDRGVGRAAVRTLADRLATQDGGGVVRLSYHPDNTPAARLYTSLGFTPTGAMEDDELVAELRPLSPSIMTLAALFAIDFAANFMIDAGRVGGLVSGGAGRPGRGAGWGWRG